MFGKPAFIENLPKGIEQIKAQRGMDEQRAHEYTRANSFAGVEHGELIKANPLGGTANKLFTWLNTYWYVPVVGLVALFIIGKRLR